MTKGLTLQEKLQEQPRKLTPAIVTGGGFKGDITASGLGASPFLKAAIPEDQVSSFGKLEVMKAAFERENTIGSFVASELSGAGQPDPNFDVIDNIRGTKYEPHLNRFKEAFNQNDFDKITRNIDREEDNSELLDNAGAFGIVSMFGASLLDPINLIPIGGEAYKAWRVGKVAKGALRTGTAGLVSTTASEAILQSTQETRTKEESLINIGAGTVLSGILGGAAAKLSKADFDVMAKKMRSDSMSPEAPFDIDPVTQEIVPRSAGAKQVVPYEQLYAKYTEETIAKGKEPVTLEAYTNKLESLSAGIGGSAAAIAKSLSKINPLLRVFNSKSLEGRTLLQDLATHNMLVGKNEVGVASQQSVETAVKQWRAGLGEAVPANKKSFLLYKNRVKSEGADSPIKNQVAWNTEVSKAMRRGDTHEIPEVAAAAKEWRSKVFEPLKNGAIETKILPEDVQVETATSYLSRLWNRKAVIANEVELRDIISNKLRTVELPKIEERFKQQELNIFSQINDLKTRQAELEFNLNKEKPANLQEAKGSMPELSDEELFDIFDRYKEASKTLKNIKPKSLLQYIKENGGIQDTRGELASRDITNKRYVGLIRNESSFVKTTAQGRQVVGVTPDDVVLRAWEEGYFPEFRERPSINDLLEAIDNEASGNKIYTESDFDKVALRDYADNFINEIEAAGIDINAIKAAKDLNLKIKETPIKKTLVNGEIELLKAKIARMEEVHVKHVKKATNVFEEVGDKEQYIDEVTDSVVSNLKGETRFGGVSNYDFKITKRGPLKERTLSFIRDEEVEQFLENDIEAIANRYTRIMGTDVELARKFEGDVNLENRLAKVADEYKALAEKAKSDKERVALQKEKQSVLTDLGALRDIMRGTYGTPDNPDALIVRSGRVARQLNYVTKLGGVVVSSIADMTRTVGVHGLGRFSKGLGRAITNSKGMKLNIVEGQKAGNVLERVLHTRLATLAELTDPLNSGQSIFERFMSNVSNLGTKFNGIALWNDVQKGFASVMTQQRMIEEMDNLVKGTIKKNDRTYLAFLGIDADNINMIKKQIDTHSFKEDSLWVANTEKWTDAEAVSIYRNALNQDVDRTIVSKTAGDVPLWMNTELGKVIGQFKSFTFASTQQVLISGLQQADAAALNGFICSASLGMLVYYLKSGIAGRETSEDPRKWIAEGIDRSGYLGIIMEINNISEKVSRGKVGINPLIGGEVMSRYVNRNGLGALMGPSFGLGQDTYQIAGAIATGEITESDVRAFRRNLPFQNIFYIQWLFNDMEKGLNQTLGTE